MNNNWTSNDSFYEYSRVNICRRFQQALLPVTNKTSTSTKMQDFNQQQTLFMYEDKYRHFVSQTVKSGLFFLELSPKKYII